MSPRDADNRLSNGECPDDETLAALLDGAIAPAVRAALEAHLIRCDPCRSTLADSAEVLGSLGDAAATAPAAPVVPAQAAPAAPLAPLAPVARRTSGRAPAIRTTATPANRAEDAGAPPLPALRRRTSGRSARIISLAQRTAARPGAGPSPLWVAAAAAILVAGIGAGIALRGGNDARPPARIDAPTEIASTNGASERAPLPRVTSGASARSAQSAGSPGAAGPTGDAGAPAPQEASPLEASPLPENGAGVSPETPGTPAATPESAVTPESAIATTERPADVSPLDGGAESQVALGTLSVSSVGGKIEARLPGDTEWRPLEAGTPLPAGASIRAGEGAGGENEVVLDGGLALSLRKDTRAVIWPSKDGLEVVLASGALAASPPERGPRSRMRVETPQGTVTSAGAPFEVHVQRKGSLVLAREGSGVSCETRFGIVGLAADQHTLLLDDRPSPRPRTLSREGREGGRDGGFEGRERREGPGHEGREGGRERRRHGPGGPGPGRGHCKPPGGPELDKLMPGDGPT